MYMNTTATTHTSPAVTTTTYHESGVKSIHTTRYVSGVKLAVIRNAQSEITRVTMQDGAEFTAVNYDTVRYGAGRTRGIVNGVAIPTRSAHAIADAVIELVYS